MSKKIGVMIVDDSLSIRLLLNGLISSSPDMEVVAMAENPIKAMEILKNTTPDVMTLDVEMPQMDGITFLKKIMKLRPLPVVMISTLTHSGSKTAIEALEYGAIDVVGKPSAVARELEREKDDILDKIRYAAYAKVGQSTHKPPTPPRNTKLEDLSFTPNVYIDDVYPKRKTPKPSARKIIAIGASTGGPGILKEILEKVTNTALPPIFIVQHMGIGFTKALADSINRVSALDVVEAKDGMPAQNGHAYVAPGGKHLLVETNLQGHLICRLSDIGRVNRHSPSVDVLFRSVSEQASPQSTAILLTGMGDDGARCLKELHALGMKTVVQNEESCAVFGMPRAALEMEHKHKVMTPIKISELIQEIKL